MTATDLVNLGIVDEIVPEPLGGAHQDPDLTAKTLGKALARHLKALGKKTPEELVSTRRARYRAIGRFVELAEVAQLELVAAPAEAGGGS
ncbi:MAG: hypothetical protein HY335_05310 [Deinococcus sp.]|nr:hypothetical protein [Deinococcus sp.]